MLSDPAKRREYDAGGFAAFGAPPDLFAGIDFEDLLRGAGLHFGGFDEFDGGLFERLFGRRRAPSSRGADIAIDIRLPLERIATGGDETVRVPRSIRCTACAGSGAKDGKVRPCEACGGTGREVKTRAEGGITLTQTRTCPACDGRGRLVDEPCPACQGAGSVEEAQSVTLQVPAGIEDGTVLRVAGHGLPGAPPGDLLISVRSAADPRFERDGADLWRVEALTIPQAVLGTQREVPTLGKPAVMSVPAGTQPDAILRLRGKGLPKYGSRTHGDLLVRIRLDVPTRLSPDERALYARLQELDAGSRKT